LFVQKLALHTQFLPSKYDPLAAVLRRTLLLYTLRAESFAIFAIFEIKWKFAKVIFAKSEVFQKFAKVFSTKKNYRTGIF